MTHLRWTPYTVGKGIVDSLSTWPTSSVRALSIWFSVLNAAGPPRSRKPLARQRVK
jgi:hypothetical protein